MEKELMILTNQESRDIVFKDTNEYITIENNVISKGRWSIFHEIIVKRLLDNKFFKTRYSKGATENQDEMPFDDLENIEWKEVIPVSKTIIVYE